MNAGRFASGNGASNSTGRLGAVHLSSIQSLTASAVESSPRTVTLPRPTDLSDDEQGDAAAEHGGRLDINHGRSRPSFAGMSAVDRALIEGRLGVAGKAPELAPALSRRPSERSLNSVRDGEGSDSKGPARGRYEKIKRLPPSVPARGHGHHTTVVEKVGLLGNLAIAKASSGIRGEPDWASAGNHIAPRNLARR